MAARSGIRHPWDILIDLVAAEILSAAEAHDVVLSHKDVHRKANVELQATVHEMVVQGDLSPDIARKLQNVLTKAARDGMPDL